MLCRRINDADCGVVKKQRHSSIKAKWHKKEARNLIEVFIFTVSEREKIAATATSKWFLCVFVVDGWENKQ
jgi:hypothetical protein